MTIKDLIESYKLKIKIVNGMIEADVSKVEKERLKQKLGIYRAFLTDLQRVDSV